MASTSLRIVRSETSCVVRVEGRGTMCESPSLRAMAMQILDEEPNTVLVVDLESCEYLDSTFLGCLLAMHKRYGQGPTCRFTIAASEAAIARLLAITRLDRVFVFTAVSTDVSSSWHALPMVTPEAHELGLHAMECHQQLGELDGPSSAAFKRIADRLAAELGVQAIHTA